MNWLDLIIVTCIGIGVIKGLFDGCIKQVVSLIALVLSILFAGLLAAWLQGFVGQWNIISPHLEYLVCYILSFVLIFLLMGWVGRLLEKVVNWSFLGCLNSAAGGLVGAIITVIILSLVFNLFVIFDKNEYFLKEQTRRESVLFEKVRAVVPTLYPYLKHKVESEWNEHPSKEKEKPGEPPVEQDKNIYEI